VSYNV